MYIYIFIYFPDVIYSSKLIRAPGVICNLPTPNLDLQELSRKPLEPPRDSVNWSAVCAAPLYFDPPPPPLHHDRQKTSYIYLSLSCHCY